MTDDHQLDFQEEIGEILRIPGVSKRMVAEWAEVDPSSVTRWCQGARPSNPVQVLKGLAPHVDRVRAEVASVRRTEVESWLSLTSGLDPGIREYVDKTGLLAASYVAIAAWIPSSQKNDQCDIVGVRHFGGVWAAMERRIYNVGDQAQIVSMSPSEQSPQFDQERPLGDIVKMEIAIDNEVGKTVARLHVQLNLDEFPYRDDSIGFIGDFGYRFRATKAIATRPTYREQTNEFLGATTPIPCRRLNLIACIPKSCFRGSPTALSSSNRSMLKVLMELDDAKPEMIESLLWPTGHRHDLSSAPNAALRAIPHVDSVIEGFPKALQSALDQPADLTRTDVTLREVLCSADSACFLLDIHEPHPSLTHNIVWRLGEVPPKDTARYGDNDA